MKLKFKLYYIIQLSYYNSESTSLTVGDIVGAELLVTTLSPKIGPMFLCELPTKSSYVIEVLLLRSNFLIYASVAT